MRNWDVLPKTYKRLENSTLVELLRDLNDIRMNMEGDAFGKIYEYFVGKFAMSEGQKGGEFSTPCFQRAGASSKWQASLVLLLLTSSQEYGDG